MRLSRPSTTSASTRLSNKSTSSLPPSFRHETSAGAGTAVARPHAPLSPHPVHAQAAEGAAPVVASNEPTTQVEFFYDILSPYSYFAFETLCRYRAEWQLDLKLKPVYLSAIMKRAENSPPGFVPAKGAYMKQDLFRLAHYFDVELKWPSALKEVMFGSLPVQRLLCAVALHAPAKLEAVTRSFWQRHWGRNQDILSRESQLAALVDAGVSAQEAEQLLAAAGEAEAKQLLSRHTEEALAYGAFGVPAMVLSAPENAGTSDPSASSAPTKHLLFGSDRFHIMAAMLRREWNGPKPRPVQRRKLVSRL